MGTSRPAVLITRTNFTNSLLKLPLLTIHFADVEVPSRVQGRMVEELLGLLGHSKGGWRQAGYAAPLHALLPIPVPLPLPLPFPLPIALGGGILTR